MAEYFGRGKRSRLKDKKVNLVRKTTVQNTAYPHEYYKIVEEGGNIWAYYRAASQKEISYADTETQEITSIFFLNWRNDIRSNDFIEYRGNFYAIVFLDDFEGYKEDIKVTAKAIDKLPAVDEDGTPTKQKIKAPADLVAELQSDQTVKLYWTDKEDTAQSVTYWYVNFKTEGGEWLETDAGATDSLNGYLHITDIYSEIGDEIRLKLYPISSYSDSYDESDYSNIAVVEQIEKTKLEAATGFAAETLESGGVVLTWEHSTDEDKATYTLSLNEGAYNQEIATGLTEETYTHEAGKGGNVYELTAMPTTESSRFYRKSDSVQVTAEKIPLIKLGTVTDFEAAEIEGGGVLLTWLNISDYEHATYTISRQNAPMPDYEVVAGLEAQQFTDTSGGAGDSYTIQAKPKDPIHYEAGAAEHATATEYIEEAPPEKKKLEQVARFRVSRAGTRNSLIWSREPQQSDGIATYTVWKKDASGDYQILDDNQKGVTINDNDGKVGDTYSINLAPNPEYVDEWQAGDLHPDRVVLESGFVKFTLITPVFYGVEKKGAQPYPIDYELSWRESNGADGNGEYNIYRKLEGEDDYKSIAKVKAKNNVGATRNYTDIDGTGAAQYYIKLEPLSSKVSTIDASESSEIKSLNNQ